MLHSVLERIWIKGSYLSQWLPQGERGPLRSQNHDELKSSTVGPNLPYDFWKSKIFKNFRITPKFFFALQYIKNWTKVVPWKKFFCSWKKSCYQLLTFLQIGYSHTVQRYQFIPRTAFAAGEAMASARGGLELVDW